MQLKIHNGTAELSGIPILTDINIEINTNSRIAIVGRNGCGKTTLLKLISGKIPFTEKSGCDSFFAVSGKPTIGTLDQMTFSDESMSLVEVIRTAYSDIIEMKNTLDNMLEEINENENSALIEKYTALHEHFTTLGGFYFEKEYEAAIKRFGFSEEEKRRPVSEFSGGQRTKIAFLRLLLSKPDLLLLDEPTNHLDINAVTWLEEYIASYKKAVVIVSHDRMFLDKTVNEIYEIEHGKTYKYHGNYTEFSKQRRLNLENAQKSYEAQQKEIARLEAVAERFRYKATKAAMAQSKLKQIDRMEKIEAPISFDEKTFKASLKEVDRSANEVLQVSGLEIGFTKPLAKISFSVFREQRIGIIGGNGLGKSTLLKTLTGKLPPISGEFHLGTNVKVGYFDQQMAQYTSENTLLEDFQSAYPALNDFEARSALGAFLFSGEDVFKRVSMLSGGERVRLALCKLLFKKPNFLILDEPTNHIDILSKETLEELLLGFGGTILFVSHDRYFTKKLAQKLIVFDDSGAKWYDNGYEQYEAENIAPRLSEKQNDTQPKQKKTYTTPGKEKAKRERAIRKAEDKISLLEDKIAQLEAELSSEENALDYVKLEQLQNELEENENALLSALEEWDNLTANEENI